MLAKGENCLLEPSLFCIKAIVILDDDGNRIIGKYYDVTIFPTNKEKKNFERNLFNKTHRLNTEVLMLDGLTCIFKSNIDLFFYVMGGPNENGLILMNVLNCVYESISQILKKNVESRFLLDNLDVVILALDEICDRGIILEADPSAVVQRVGMRSEDLPIGEQSVVQVLQNAKDQLKWTLLR